MQPRYSPNASPAQAVIRVRIWYGLLSVVVAIFAVRLFYLQIIRHDYYKKAALAGQLKEYEVRADRGIIEAHDGDQVVPIVLNETRYTLFADPKYTKDISKIAIDVQRIIGGNASDYEKQMKVNTRYSVLAKKLTKDQKTKIDDLKVKGLGTREEAIRTYPQTDLAAQLLGFVDNEGTGKYGIEQALNKELSGTPGSLKAITDAEGVPLVANKDNINIEPKSGARVVLTIDVSMQRQLEDLLKAQLERSKSKSGGALIMDANTGAIKAMANFPTFNPGEFYKQEDANVFNNGLVSDPLEPGSIMKPLTAAAALDLGVVNKNTTYYDPSRFTIDDATVTNIEEDGGAGTRSIADILQLSLNTGAVYLLKQMGGGEVNQKARTNWHNYMVDHYQFGKATGIEQGYEAEGNIPDPIKGYGLNIQYANTSFGQGMTATPLQMAGALASVVNGGTYYRPRLVDALVDSGGTTQKKSPDITRKNVVSSSVSSDMRSLLENVVAKNYRLYGLPAPSPLYSVGGKTGTAQISKPGGGYYDDRYNGTFMGYIGGDMPQYIIITRANEPKTPGYAGTKAAAPIFTDTINMLINNFGVTPRK